MFIQISLLKIFFVVELDETKRYSLRRKLREERQTGLKIFSNICDLAYKSLAKEQLRRRGEAFHYRKSWDWSVG